jgi:hypothetical protein
MRRKRVPNIVPPLVLSAAFVGVIPACALVSCGSSEGPPYMGGDVAAEAFGWKDVKKPTYDVAACCFDGDFSVADATFGDAIDDTPPMDAPDEETESGRDS